MGGRCGVDDVEGVYGVGRQVMQGSEGIVDFVEWKLTVFDILKVKGACLHVCLCKIKKNNCMMIGK